MMRSFVAVVALVAAVSPLLAADKKEDKKMSALDFKMTGLDGKEVDLSKYKGKVVLYVNVASKCGYTKQYTGLQALYEKYEKDGLVIIGVPANDFGAQEPGTDEDIAKFCSSKYNVTFPMLSKVSVKGKEITPLYKYLTSKEANDKTEGEVKWNFEKFLVNRKGETVGRFKSSVAPDAEELTKAVKVALDEK
jgi:glutathione peroxidase